MSCPIRQLHKRRHHGRPRTRQDSLTPHSNPVCNTGQQSILRLPNTLPHFFQRHCESPNPSFSQVTANLTCSRVPTRLSHTFSEGDKAYPNCITTEGDHCNLSTYTLQFHTQACVQHPSAMHKGTDTSNNICHHRTQPYDPVLQSRYHLRSCPRPSPFNCWQGGTQLCYVAALSRISIKKNKPMLSSTLPVGRRSNICTSSAAPTATPGSRPSPKI